MTERSLFPDSVEVRQRDLAYTESTKSAQLRQRMLDTLGPARRAGLTTTVNGADGTRIDVSAGRGYTPNGELAILSSAQLAISLSDYTDNVNNFVYLTYREQATTPAAHETDGSSRNTRAEALVGISVLTAAEYAGLPATNSADLTTLAQDRMLLIATVNADGIGQLLEAADITLEPITTLANEATVDAAIAAATVGRQRLGYIPDIDPASPAAGDGVTDDAAALAAAITQVPTGGTLDLGGKTFLINSAVDVPRSDITIANGTILMTGLSGADAPAFTSTGSTSLPTNTTNFAVANQRTNIEFADLTGYAVGDIVFISSSSVAYSNGIGLGELHRITAISGNFIDIERGLLGDYTGTGTMVKVTPRSNIVFDRVNFIGSTPVTPSNIRTAIRFNLCHRPTVRNCTFNSVYTYGIEFIRTFDGTVDSCAFNDSILGEGIRITNGCYNIRASRCTANNTLTLFRSSGLATSTGVNVGIHLSNSYQTGPGTVAYFDPNTYDCSVDGSTSLRASIGVICYGDRATISNNKIRYCASHGILCQPAKFIGDGNKISVTNNDIDTPTEHGIIAVTATGGRGIQSLVISNNRIAQTKNLQSAIQVNAAEAGIAVEGVTITGNTSLHNSSATHINLITTVSGALIQGVTVNGNSMLGGTVSGLRLGCNIGATIRDVSGSNTARGISVGMQVENSGLVERIHIDGTYEANIGYDIINNTGSNLNSSEFLGSVRGIGDISLGTGNGVKVTNSGIIDRTRFVGNFNATSNAVRLETLINGTTNDIEIGGIIRADGNGVNVTNTGTVSRLNISGNVVGGANRGVSVINNGIMGDVGIDAIAVGATDGCYVSHNGVNTLNGVSIRGRYTGLSSSGIHVGCAAPSSPIENVLIDASASGDDAGTRMTLLSDSFRFSIAGTHNAGSSNGSGLNISGLSSATSLTRVTITGTYEGGLNGVQSTMALREATFNGVARGVDRGMFLSAYIGTATGTFVGGTNEAFTTTSGTSNISLSGFTLGGTYGVRSTSGLVLCVGVFSSGFSIAARSGAGVNYGNASAGHSLP